MAGVRTEGRIHVLGQDIYDPAESLYKLRNTVGMVFERLNPLPLSI